LAGKGASRITGNENKLVSDAPIGLFRPKSSSDARKSEFPLTGQLNLQLKIIGNDNDKFPDAWAG
jgi:hypothetical protein